VTALRLGVIAVLTVVFQALTAPYYEFGGARPDFVLIVLAAYAFEAPARATWIATICAGALLDVLSIDPFGGHLLSLIVVVLVVQQGAGRGRGFWRGFGDGPLVRVVLVAVGIVAGLTIRPLVFWLLSGNQPSPAHLPLIALYTLTFALPALPVVRRFAIAGAGPRQGDFRARSSHGRYRRGGRFW
jgi:rod shape-determining protein MreD